MDDRMKREIVSIFNERILSPVLYMVEYDDIVDLICFCDRNIIIGEIYDTAQSLRLATGKQFEIVDIREFDEADRLDIIHNAELIYSEDKLIERIFKQSMLEDFEIMMREREEAHIRYEDNHSPYVQ